MRITQGFKVIGTPVGNEDDVDEGEGVLVVGQSLNLQRNGA